MTQQLSLFPDSPLNISNSLTDEKLADLETLLNPVDEVFAASSRFRDSRNVMELLRFIARFPGYSAFNGLLLYTQNSSATYVATARSWKQKFGRQPKFDARPIVILAPMAPILFLFDIQDTEGLPVPSARLRSRGTRNQLPGKVYPNTRHNCELHGIAVYETMLDHGTADTANRITPVLRKQCQDLNLQKDTSYLILIDKAQTLEDKYSSLTHELGHIFCGHLGIDRHAWWPEREDLNINGEEIEADAAAYLVCARLGLQASSAKHLSNYMEKNHELPVFSLNAVLQSVGYIEEMGKSRWKEPRRRRR
jgi:Zn-dependent peptidase ImmA (M78 family)